MPLTARRPRRWNEIVGQERVRTVLAAVVEHERRMPRGFVFEGVRGVGKTSAAYLFAKALMCLKPDKRSESCACPSCAGFAGDLGLVADLHLVDAARVSGPDRARELAAALDRPPALARRPVAVVDPADGMGPEAWDSFPRWLEEDGSAPGPAIVFVSGEPGRVPAAVRSRCLALRFALPSRDDLVGLLARLASDEDLSFRNDALERIAALSKGRVRDAVRMLDIAAATGRITLESVEKTFGPAPWDRAEAVFRHLARGEPAEACRIADEAARLWGAPALVKEMFSAYSRGWHDPEGPLGWIRSAFPALKATTALLVKWSSSANLPADAAVLFADELADLAAGSAPPAAATSVPVSSPVPEPGPAPKRERVPATEAEVRRRFPDL